MRRKVDTDERWPRRKTEKTAQEGKKGKTNRKADRKPAKISCKDTNVVFSKGKTVQLRVRVQFLHSTELW